MSTKIALGQQYKDSITGFKGIAVSRIEYITGCIQYELQPHGVQKDGTTKAAKWFDECRITCDGKGPKGGPAPSSVPMFSHP